MGLNMKSHRFKSLCISSILSCCAISLSTQAADAVLCAKRTDLAGPCYQIHGRLNSWNGGPATEKIWVVGTKRYLSIYNRTESKIVMPKAINDQLNSFETEIYADFLVCPYEKEVPGVMSYVCVESAKKILVERHETIDGHDQVRYLRIPDTQGSELIAL